MSDAAPWLSVLIPVHRAERFLAACVSSVLMQADDGVEILLLVDASPDGSGAMADALAEQRPGAIRVFHHVRNLGVAAARNRLVAQARGDYVWFMDADDVMLPGAIASLRAVVARHAPVLVSCDFRVIDAAGRDLRRFGRRPRRSSFAGAAGVPSRDRSRLVAGWLEARQLHVWSKIAKRALWSQARFPEGMAMMEDAAVVPALAAGADSHVHVAESWIGYRAHGGSALATLAADRLQDLFAAVRMVHAGFARLPDLDARARFAVDYYCLRMLAYAARRLDGAAAEDRLRAALHAAAAEVFPHGVGDVLARCRRRGWWLRSRRMARDLRRAGVPA